jgi:hypothetical protein
VYIYNNIFEGEVYHPFGFARSSFSSTNTIKVRQRAVGLAHTAIGSFTKDTIEYIGLIGSGSIFGVADIAAYSGSASTISRGRSIGGVSESFCYKCYSEVDVTAPNGSVGGIVAMLNGIGTIEIGESKAKINAPGIGNIGGLVAATDAPSSFGRSNFGNGLFYVGGYAHTNIINSKFSGSIIASGGNVGGIIGSDGTDSNPILTNVSMTGSITGAAKSGRYIGSIQSSCNTEHRVLKIRNTTSTSSLPSVGIYYGASLENGIEY